MSSRFEDVPQWVYDKMNEIRRDSFTHLTNAAIRILYDTKKRKSKGSYVLGRMQKSNDLVRKLTVDEVESPEGTDYIMYLDKAVFENVDESDQTRIIRHELCHADVDLDSDNPYKIIGHEIEDFYSEIEYNKDDPRWTERCATVAESVYERED